MRGSKSIKKMSEQEIKIDMTPMIDVTFLLLIFFMCTLHFKDIEGVLNSYMPKDEGIFNVPATANPQEPIHIILTTKNKETIIDIGSSSFKGKSKFSKLLSNLGNIVEKYSIAGNDKKISVIIDPQKEIIFQDVISTLDACHKIQRTKAGKNIEIKFASPKK